MWESVSSGVSYIVSSNTN